MARKPKPALPLAQKLLKQSSEDILELRADVFKDDEAAHDDEMIEKLYEEFSANLDAAVDELSKKLGKPAKTGKTEDKAIPINGVFRFAFWKVGKKKLWIVASHEDREIPILLLLGTA